MKNHLDPEYLDALCLDVATGTELEHNAVTIGRRAHRWVVVLLLPSGVVVEGEDETSPATAAARARIEWRKRR